MKSIQICKHQLSGQTCYLDGEYKKYEYIQNFSGETPLKAVTSKDQDEQWNWFSSTCNGSCCIISTEQLVSTVRIRTTCSFCLYWFLIFLTIQWQNPYVYKIQEVSGRTPRFTFLLVSSSVKYCVTETIHK